MIRLLGVGFSELTLILLIALIFVGPDKLPEIGRTIGKITKKINHTAKIIMEDETTIMLKKGHKSEEEIFKKAFVNIENDDCVDESTECLSKIS